MTEEQDKKRTIQVPSLKELNVSKILIAVAFVMFIIAGILIVGGGDLGFEPLGWIAFGLASWALAHLA